MKYYGDFKRTGDSFEERVGEPDSFSAAIGRITLNFSELEEQLSSSISKMLNVDEETGHIVTCELSFKNKLHMLISLVRQRVPTTNFNTGYGDTVEMCSELMKLCFKAEELRNQVMHSSWAGSYLSNAKVRRKVTAKASKGLNIYEEDIDAGYLLDIADFIICVAMDVEEFFLEMSPKAT